MATIDGLSQNKRPTGSYQVARYQGRTGRRGVDAPDFLHFRDRLLVGLSIFPHFIRTFQLFSIVYEPGTDHRTR